ncbi:MAG: VCBS repeat-containing protein [Planctomycetota bacterium]
MLPSLAVPLALAIATTLSPKHCERAEEERVAEDHPPVFRLSAPEITKLDWNTRALSAHDLNGDGLTDLAVLGNDRARIELLYQKAPGSTEVAGLRSVSTDRWEPVLEDARFVKGSVVTGIAMFDLEVGDLNGDGRADLAYTGRPDPLTIRYQGTDEPWSPGRVIDIGEPSQWTSTLEILDVNGDGRNDLVVLTQKELLVLTQNEKGDLARSETFTLSDESCYGLGVIDADGDAILDLFYLVAQKRDALRIRLRGADGRFGPERPFRIEAPSGQLASFAPERGLPNVLAGVQGRTHLVELLRASGGHDSTPAELKLEPQLFSVTSTGQKAAVYAVGDFDGDDRPDLAVADSGGASVAIFLQLAAGRFAAPKSFPCLAETSSLAAGDLDGDGRDELVMTSPKEKTLAVSELTKEGRLSYPAPLPATGKPLAVQVFDLDGDGVAEVVSLEEENKARRVTVMRSGGPKGTWSLVPFGLDGLKADPRGLAIVDADQDGLADLAVFTVQEAMRILVQQPDHTFVAASVEAKFRQGLVHNIEPSAFSVSDVNGDGKAEMIVAQKGFARALRMTSGGVLEVVDQYNARSPEDEIAAALAVDLDGEGAPEIVLVNTKGQNLQILRAQEGGVYRFTESLPIGTIDLVGTAVSDIDANGRPDIFLFGAKSFWWLPTGAPGLVVESLATYETDLKEVEPSAVAVGDLDTDGRKDLVVIDARSSHVMEILAQDSSGRWNNALYFKIFEADPHYRGRAGAPEEPREFLVTDLTGDRRDDIALLIHDRLLLYAQE